MIARACWLLPLLWACQTTPGPSSSDGAPSLVADAGATNPALAGAPSPNLPPRQDPMDKLQTWLALRGLTQEQLASALQLDPSKAEPKRSYEKLQDLTDLHDPAHHPASFYLRDNHTILIYLSDTAALQGLTEMLFLQAWGKPALTLRSRAGKASTLCVYPERGVAFSTEQEDGPLDFLEIFAPMTAEDYRAQIYVDPGSFDK